MRRCIFCHLPLSGNKAREHVLPRWLEREIGGEFRYYDHPIDGDTAGEFSVGDTDRVAATASTRVEGRVCADCNNTWLNSLETFARSTVSELVFGRTSVGSLTARDQKLLAAWLYKTLLVAVSSGPGEFEIHGCDYHQFRATGEPGDWLNIYAAVLDSTCTGFCGPMELKWVMPGRETSDPPADPADLGLKWVYHVGKLHVVLCHSANPVATQVVLEGLHTPVWTPQRFATENGRLATELADDSLLQWIAFGLIPMLRLESTPSAGGSA